GPAHGRRRDRAAVGGGARPRRRNDPLFRRWGRCGAAAAARDPVLPRADAHRHLLVVAGGPGRGARARDGGRGGGRAVDHAPAPAFGGRPRGRADASTRGPEGLRGSGRRMSAPTSGGTPAAVGAARGAPPARAFGRGRGAGLPAEIV